MSEVPRWWDRPAARSRLERALGLVLEAVRNEYEFEDETAVARAYGAALDCLIAPSSDAERGSTSPTRTRSARELRDVLEAMLDRPSTRLACYGTLRPGEANYWVLADLGGNWQDGTVEGAVADWLGYPRLTWTSGGSGVAVKVLQSERLGEAWSRIDDFEGSEYVRSLVPVRINDSIVVASCYLARR